MIKAGKVSEAVTISITVEMWWLRLLGEAFPTNSRRRRRFSVWQVKWTTEAKSSDIFPQIAVELFPLTHVSPETHQTLSYTWQTSFKLINSNHFEHYCSLLYWWYWIIMDFIFCIHSASTNSIFMNSSINQLKINNQTSKCTYSCGGSNQEDNSDLHYIQLLMKRRIC